MYRILSEKIMTNFESSKPSVVLIIGLRQTGKSTLAKSVCNGKKYQLFNFDLISDQQEFTNQNRHSLADFAERYKDTIILIDEVQKMPEATSVIKHLYDQYQLKFILTGSSELKIKENIGDSLAGRMKIFRLYPLSLKEILIQNDEIKVQEEPSFDLAQTKLNKYLIFGSLPTIQNIEPENYSAFLHDFTETLLSKDILEVADIKKSTQIFALTKLLALQIGQLVNVNELANMVDLKTRTSIYNYLDILEQMNIICRAYPISTNERKAISTKFKVYFTDLGIRNYLVGNFDSLQNRLDSGVLLENAIYLGIKRKLDYTGDIYKLGFFRSKTGQEVDIVLQSNGQEQLFEVKSAEKYMNKQGQVSYITPKNAWEYLL